MTYEEAVTRCSLQETSESESVQRFAASQVEFSRTRNCRTTSHFASTPSTRPSCGSKRSVPDADVDSDEGSTHSSLSLPTPPLSIVNRRTVEQCVPLGGLNEEDSGIAEDAEPPSKKSKGNVLYIFSLSVSRHIIFILSGLSAENKSKGKHFKETESTMNRNEAVMTSQIHEGMIK